MKKKMQKCLGEVKRCKMQNTDISIKVNANGENKKNKRTASH